MRTRLPRLLLLLAACCAALPWAGPARADEGELQGEGYRLKLPAGFRLTAQAERAHGVERTYQAEVEGGRLTLTLSSSEADSLDAGATGEVALAVRGAQEAFTAVSVGPAGTERRLRARLDEQVLVMSLTAPVAGERLAMEAWADLQASLRMEAAGRGWVALLPWAVVALGLLALGLHLSHRGAQGSAPAPSADGFAPPVLARRTSQFDTRPRWREGVPVRPSGAVTAAAPEVPHRVLGPSSASLPRTPEEEERARIRAAAIASARKRPDVPRSEPRPELRNAYPYAPRPYGQESATPPMAPVAPAAKAGAAPPGGPLLIYSDRAGQRPAKA